MTPVITPTMTEGRCYIMQEQICAIKYPIGTLLQHTRNVHIVNMDPAFRQGVNTGITILVKISRGIDLYPFPSVC